MQWIWYSERDNHPYYQRSSADIMVISRILRYLKSNIEGGLISEILLLGSAAGSILWSIYFAVVTISIPYPIELREGASQVMTRFFLSGSNPFVLQNQPLAMNNYGLGYNLVVAPFAALLGNTLLVHRSVTFGFILLSAVTGFFAIHKLKRNIALGLAYAAFIMIGLINRGGIGAFPSAMGVFLFMMTVFIPFFKGFTPISLLLSSLFSIAAFYSKAYFVLGFGVVASYLFLFVSKKTGLLYSLYFFLFFVVSFFVVRFAFPLYFIDTIIGNISNTSRSAAHMYSQMKQLWLYFFPILLSSSLVLLSTKGHALTGAMDQPFNIQKWESPLINVSLDYFLYASVCSLLAFIFLLGPHIGSYLSYAYQLIIPVFFCWFFLNFNPQRKMGFLIVVLIVFNLFFWQKSVLPPQMLEQKASKEWSSLYSYIQPSANILNSSVITSAMIDSGLSPIDSGQTVYYYFVKPYPDSPLFGISYAALRSDGFEYIKFIDNSLAKQKFDLIFTTLEKGGTFYHMGLVEKFYMPITEIKVEMPQTDQQWTILIWKPIVK